MKTTKLLLGIFLSTCVFCTSLFAQKNTCYKGVCIMRGESDKNCVYVKNDNAYEVDIRFDYKLVSDKSAPWINYPGNIRVAPREQVGLLYTKVACIDKEIKALRLAYVDILKPSVGEEIMKALFEDNSNK